MRLFKKIRKAAPVARARHRLAYFVILGLYRGSGLLPWRWLVRLGRFLGGAVFALSRPFRPRALLNLERVFAPAAPGADLPQIARDSYRNLAVTVLETGRLGRLSDAEFLSLVDYSPADEATLGSLMARGRGVIFASAHLGNWEMLAGFGPRIGIGLSVLYKAPTNPYLDGFLRRIRGTNRLLDIDRDLPAVLNRLRGGKAVALLFDENARGRGVRLPFFGFSASTYRGPAYFCLRAGSPILCAYFIRQPSGRHRLLLERVIEPIRRGSLDEDILAILKEMNRSLEEVIRAYPGQWNWTYRRWGRDPVPWGLA